MPESYDRPRGEVLVPHIEDTSVWQPFKRSHWLADALELYAPHPAAFRRVWGKVAEEKSKNKQEDRSKPLYAWEPLPPMPDCVALGMLFATTLEQPDVTSVRVMHRAWTRVAAEMPTQLWDDRGMGGRAKSLWMVNNLNLVWATNGWNQPPGPFYEMRPWPFTLKDISHELILTDGAGAQGAREADGEEAPTQPVLATIDSESLEQQEFYDGGEEGEEVADDERVAE